MNRAARCNARIAADAPINGRFWWDLWPFEVQPVLVQAFRMALSGEPTSFEAFRISAQETPQWWSISIAPIGVADGSTRLFLVSGRDVTARVLAEAARSRD